MSALQKIIKFLIRKSPIHYYVSGRAYLNDIDYKATKIKSQIESSKSPSRTEIINYLLTQFDGNTSYLEIGVRNPADNFDLINANEKYGVDPGKEFPDNNVAFQITSDEFFEKLEKEEILSGDKRFDLIFIDGLHLADQADRDITNALKYIKKNGFVVLHDCNPPSWWHARENFQFHHSPAKKEWNGTTWKAFLKWRFNPVVYSCCIDTDWGIGILSKKITIGRSITPVNPFYEFDDFDRNRIEYLNLISFDTFQSIIEDPEIQYCFKQ